jgi:Type II CAAX prenyl endopeptidase Rce1-like
MGAHRPAVLWLVARDWMVLDFMALWKPDANIADGLRRVWFILSGALRRPPSCNCSPSAPGTFRRTEGQRRCCSRARGSASILGAAVISSNATFRRAHQQLGYLVVLNSWIIGIVLFWLMFNYGLVASIIAHIAYDLVVFATVVALRRLHMRRLIPSP